MAEDLKGCDVRFLIALRKSINEELRSRHKTKEMEKNIKISGVAKNTPDKLLTGEASKRHGAKYVK